MAASTITVTVTSTDWTGKNLIIFGTVAWSPSTDTYTTGGNTMSFAGFDDIKSSSLPNFVEVISQPTSASHAANVYVYQFLPGTTLYNGTLQIFTGAAAQTGLTELTSNAAIPSGVSGDTIKFRASFPRL